MLVTLMKYLYNNVEWVQVQAWWSGGELLEVLMTNIIEDKTEIYRGVGMTSKNEKNKVVY